MKARFGFVLFFAIFVVIAIAVPLLEQAFRLFQVISQFASRFPDQCIRTARSVTQKINEVEWKRFMQKA